ncbi:MAG: CRISPR system precrRNA processing endoribonuclease RAMP protein Cas6 [Bacillota bacterium]
MPDYKGATFRGGFGRIFRQIACSLRQRSCKDCLLMDNCSYAYIFETAPPKNSQALSKYESIPRPFVLDPPLETKNYYAPGEMLAIDFILIGNAIKYLPYFIIVFREMGVHGLGRGRRPFALTDVSAIGLDDAVSIYNPNTNVVRSIDLSYSGSQLIERAIPSLNLSQTKELKIEFLTPVSLKDEGQIAFIPEFHILFRQAMRRISALSYFHHEDPLEVDYAGLAEGSKQVELVENRTVWKDWERYSQRQRQRVNMGGLIGSATYRGDLEVFLPWLVLGQQVHVGKNAVFGLGKYRIHVF